MVSAGEEGVLLPGKKPGDGAEQQHLDPPQGTQRRQAAAPHQQRQDSQQQGDCAVQRKPQAAFP
jgi:hypothetical protein